MSVQLREKKISGGRVSYYLDIYHNKSRWYETLNIHINKKKLTDEDRDKKRLAQEIRSKRENELIVQENGLVDKSQRKACFAKWFENYLGEKSLTNSRSRHSLIHLQKYLNGRILPFHAITADWIKTYSKHLLSKVSNNTAFGYLKDFFTAMEEALRQGIIFQNPFRKVAKNEKVKLKPIFRSSFTLDELQILWDSSFNIELQYKQAYFFSCFTGLRWSDVNPLRWSEIIIKTIDGKKEWFVYFEQEKTEDIEYLPLSDQAIEILRERKTANEESSEKSLFVFPKVKESDQAKARVYKRVWKALKRWAVAAGFDPKRLHFHSGRHTFATNILENSPDADLWTVSKLLGHKSIQPTMIYAHVRDNRKRSAVKALPSINLNTTVKINVA